MEGTLKVSTDQLKSAAGQFSTSASTVSTLTQSMTTLVDGLSSIWTGEAANAYRAKFDGLNDDIALINKKIQEHVDDLNQMADNYANAENDINTQVNTLSSDVIIS
jgi:WXG100 family type VII secretion target